MMSSLESLYETNEDFQKLLQTGASNNNIIDFVIDNVVLEGLHKSKQKYHENKGEDEIDLIELKNVKKVIPGWVDIIQRAATGQGRPIKPDLYYSLSRPENSFRLNDIVEAMSTHKKTNREEVLGMLKNMREKEIDRSRSQTMVDNGYDNDDVVKMLNKDVHLLTEDDMYKKEENGKEKEEEEELEVNRVPQDEAHPELGQDDEQIALHDRAIDRLALRSTKYGIESGDDLQMTSAEIKKEAEAWKTMHYVAPGYGLIDKGKRNVLFEGNQNREKIAFKKPLLSVGEQSGMRGNDIPQVNQPFRAETPLSRQSILVNLLAEELVRTNKELIEARRGGAPIINDMYDEDRTELNHSRPLGDVYQTVFTEGNVGQKRKMLRAYDDGKTQRRTSVFERKVDSQFCHI